MTSPRLRDLGRTTRKSRLRALRTVPILPSLVTLGNVFFGFLAIAKAADAVMMKGAAGAVMTPAVVHKLELSALLIFVAMLFDGLDGFVARLTRQTSSFGAQLDSMADMVTFGVAPAFLAKVVIDFHVPPVASALTLHPKLIYVSAVIYVLCATMRLARFNVETPSSAAEDHQEFAGLPSPAGAAVVAALVALFCVLKAAPENESTLVSWLSGLSVELWIVRVLPVCLVVLGLLMVSRLPYPHLVASVLRSGHSFPFLATLVVLAGLVALEWQLGLVAIIGIYLLSGLVLGSFRLVTTGRLGAESIPPYDEDHESPDPPGGAHLN